MGGVPDAARAPATEEATVEEAFAIERSNCEIFLAHVDGRPAGTARFVIGSIGVFLIGGATAAWARGRGAYRALVRARWDAAVVRGTPLMVTHADPATSGPILRRLGLRHVCELSRLEGAVRDRARRVRTPRG